MELHLTTSGFQVVELADSEYQLNLYVDKHRNVKLAIPYGGIEVLRNSHIELAEGASLTLLMKNVKTCPNQLMQHAILHKDASLTIAYWEIENGASQITLDVELLESGAQVIVRSACIAKAQKDFKILCTHKVPYTTSHMENYAIVEDNGNYRMEATGKIVKGAYASESHQTSRVLTLSEQHNSEVLPVLLIDENDVKASHATTLGQPDENQLYYLQSRGLSREQALGLLTVGYLMPISELFDDEAYRSKMKNEIEKRVGLHA